MVVTSGGFGGDKALSAQNFSHFSEMVVTSGGFGGDKAEVAAAAAAAAAEAAEAAEELGVRRRRRRRRRRRWQFGTDFSAGCPYHPKEREY